MEASPENGVRASSGPGPLQRLRAAGVRAWRLVALAAAAWMLHKSVPAPMPFASSVEEARAFFPTASRLEAGPGETLRALDAEGILLGTLAQTSPAADGVIGYSGPSNLLVALNPEGALAGFKILSSGDTVSHVEALQNSTEFATALRGWNPVRDKPPAPAGVGGSTLTALAMLEAVALRFHGHHVSLRFPEPLTIGEVRLLFPSAAAHVPDAAHPSWTRVLDVGGALLGYVLRTSPAGDAVTGYAGPTESLVAVAPDRETLLRVHLRKSYDTEEYVERIPEDPAYLKALVQWKLSEWRTLDYRAEKIEGVAGATLTSYAVAEGLKRRAQLEAEGAGSDSGGGGGRGTWPGGADVALVGVLLGAMGMSFSRLRGSPRLRVIWQVVVVGVLGLWLGQMLSLGLLAGWARHGLPWSNALPLVVFAGVALLVPWGARRQLYCHQVCPHGALQEWVGRLRARPVVLPPGLHGALRRVPGGVLAAAFLAALWWPSLSLGALEPFDFWVVRVGAVISGCVAVAGVGVSFFVPMAYCRYGCPTGALLGFVRSTSAGESFTRRDAAAFAVLVGGFFLLQLRDAPRGPLPGVEPEAPAVRAQAAAAEARGAAFGTGWCVKARGENAQRLSGLHAALQDELERIESGLSHWRKESETSHFNASRSTGMQPVSGELAGLVKFARGLWERSDGALDITVAPLVEAWGYGPAGPVATGPEPARLARMLEAVGFEKLESGPDGASLQKTHPELALDLGAVLQGYALDAMARILDGAGVSEYLVEVGGELRARGAWRVVLENPREPDGTGHPVELRDAALATSGLERARRRLSGRTVSHIVSARTGQPVEDGLEMVSVQAASGLEADGWATALLAAGMQQALRIAARENLQIWYIDSSGGFHVGQRQ